MENLKELEKIVEKAMWERSVEVIEELQKKIKSGYKVFWIEWITYKSVIERLEKQKDLFR